MILRPYQQDAVNAVWEHLRTRQDNPCVVLPTGTGKSLVLAQLATDAVTLWQARVIILAHVKELLEQNADKLNRLCPDLDVGIYSAGLGHRDTDHPVIVAGIQSVYQRADELGPFDVVIVDEAHLIPADGDGMYRTFIAAAQASNPKLRVVGMTATPYRLKGGMICQPENILNHVCCEAGIREMIAQNYLCPVRSRGSAVKADLANLHTRGGEFIAGEIAEAMDKTELVDAACKEIAELTGRRKSTLIFTASVEHCHHVARQVQAITGAECGVVTGETPADDRAETLGRFKAGRLKYLANVNVLTTGFDAPNVDCVVLLRPTASTGLYVQMVGRGTRIHFAKRDCTVLDYGGNVLRHGPIDAVQPSGGTGGGEAPCKECPTCMAVIMAGCSVCPECGHVFPAPEGGFIGLDDNATTAGVLSGEVTDTDYQVDETYYTEHRKAKGDENTPRTMKVQYRCGLADYHSEWVCPEHTGYARCKFETWWQARSNDPLPSKAAEAVEIAENGGLAIASQITVRHVAGEKYDRIIDCVLGDMPPRMDGGNEREPAMPDVDNIMNLSFDEIPF